MKMFFVNDDSAPESGYARRRESAIIPPFSFSGPLETSESGIWSPPRTIILAAATITAQWPGPLGAIFHMFRIEFGGQRTRIGTGILSPYNETPFGGSQEAKLRSITSQTRNNFTIVGAGESLDGADPPTVTPFEGICISSLVDSGHESVVIQLIGEYQ
jgi:hypothetical protein